VLETVLAAQRLYAYTNRSANERAVRAHPIDVVARDRLAENAVGVGDRAPLFVLRDGTGAELDVRALLRSGPVVLCFYRGGWCPYCNLELRAYQQKLGQIRQLGASLVAISPGLPDRTLTTAEANQLGYPVLSDVGNTVARQYRLTHTIDPEVVRYQLRNGTTWRPTSSTLTAWCNSLSSVPITLSAPSQMTSWWFCGICRRPRSTHRQEHGRERPRRADQRYRRRSPREHQRFTGLPPARSQLLHPACAVGRTGSDRPRAKPTG